jgi:hypothetical protein
MDLEVFRSCITKVPSLHFPLGTEESHENRSKDSLFLAGIREDYLPDATPEHCSN